MVRKPDARKLMYDRAVKDYGDEFISKLIELCRNVRRGDNLQEGDEKRWSINGLLRSLGKEIQTKYNVSHP